MGLRNMIRKKMGVWILAAAFALGTISQSNVYADPYVEPENPETLSDEEYVEGEIIVGFVNTKESDDTDSSDCTTLMEASDVEIVVVDTNGKSVEAAIEEYMAMPNVVFAEPNYIIHPAMDSPDFTPDQYYPTGSTGGIDVPDWNTTPTGADDVIVAVIDSGVEYEHEDLKDVIWNDGLNYPELVAMGGGAHGFNAAAYVDGGVSGSTDAPVPSPADGGYHGTHVAGTIAASWNGKGVSGITNDVKLMILRTATEEGSVEMDNVVAAYDYLCKAHDAGVNVVVANNSWGGHYISYASLYAIREATKRGMIMVFATGNENLNLDTNDSLAYLLSDLPNVILVNASDNNEGLAHFSNYGQFSTDIYAPGTDIISTMPNNWLYANPNHSTPILENDFEVESDLIVEGYDEEGNPIPSMWGDGGGYQGSDGYIPGNDIGSEYKIYSNEDLSEEKPRYLTFMVEKDRVYNKDMFRLEVDTTDGDKALLNDGGIVEAGKWNAVSFELPDNTDYENFNCVLSPEEAFLKPSGDDESGVRIDNVMLTNDAWPYYKLSGTSMAAPVVTGEVAAIAVANPDDSPRMLVARTLGSVKKKAELSDRCITGGIANLRNALEGRYSPVIFDAQINDDEIVVDGEFFTGSGDLYINDSPVNVTEWTDNHIVASADGIDRSIRLAKVEVRNNNIEGFNSGVRYVHQEVTRTDFTEVDIPEEMDKMSFINYSAVSLGDCIYFMTGNAEATVFYITEYNTKTGEWKDITGESGYGFLTGQIVAYKGRIVTIANKEDGDSQVFTYDPDTDEIIWIPIDNIGYYKGCTLLNYKGELLIMGGGETADFEHYNPNYDILRVDLKARNLTKVGSTEDTGVAVETVIPYYDKYGNVYLGYSHQNWDTVRVIKVNDNEYKVMPIDQKTVPNDNSSIDSIPAYAMAYAEEGMLVSGSDVFAASDEVLSDSYLGEMDEDGYVTFSNIGKLFDSTYMIRPMSVVNGQNYYVLASCRGSKNLGKSLRYIDGFTEIVPEGSTKEETSANVSFKVENGSWDDGTKTDKTVALTGDSWNGMYLTAGDIPGVGTKPDASFATGSWDTVPSVDTEITEDTVYTYTYAATDKIVYSCVEGAGGVWTKGSQSELKFVHKRSVDDATTFDHFTGILVDGKAVDKANYTAESGSVIVKLKPAYLETLSVGAHTITTQFDDGDDVTVSFTINDKSGKSDSTPSGNSKAKSPKTADSFDAIQILIMLISGCGILVIMRSRKKYYN